MMKVRRLGLNCCCILLIICQLSYSANQNECKSVESIQRHLPSGADEPTKVRVGLYIIDIKYIDDVHQSYLTDFVLSYRWNDPQLRFKSNNKDAYCVYKLLDVWHPQLEVFNMRNLTKKLDDIVRVKSDGEVEYLQRYIGSLASSFDLKRFPRDTQLLPVQVLSFEYGPDKLELKLDPESTGRRTPFSIASWNIGEGVPNVDVFTAKSSHLRGMQIALAVFTYNIKATRIVRYYVWKIILPLSLIMFMSWAVFFIDPIKIEVQIGLAATTILTLIAFLFSIDRLLPKISYLTLIDFFTLFSILLVFLAFVESVITCTMGLNGKVERARAIDYYSRFIFPLCYIAMMTYFWI